MVKSKVFGEEGKSDDLEIISIGALYCGPWDKKYWSSSRGRDRYPYPVGYKAVRAHNGNTYKMEIQEGPKGPLFLIKYSGESCSGQTPDIAWEKFQKMGISHLKIWHGKRFSCKMDGVELFGFKNPLVQRLLRELMANINGTAENSFLDSSSAEASKMRVDERCSATCEYPNLLPYMDRPAARKKRSRRSEVCLKTAGCDSLKKWRSWDMLSNGEVSNLAPQDGRNHEPSYSPEGEKDPCGFPRIMPHELHLNALATEETQSPSPEDPLLMKSTSLFVNPGEPIIPMQKTGQLPYPEVLISKPVSDLSKEVNVIIQECGLNKKNFDFLQLGRLEDMEDKNFHSMMAPKGRAGDLAVLKESQDIPGSNLCAPDTLESIQDDTMISDLNTEDDTIHHLKEECFNEGLLPEPQKGGLAESSLNMNSEKRDSDSAGQDVDKSMMKLLLPQAIPLLKKPSNRRQEKYTTLETPFSNLNHTENNQGMSPNVKAYNIDNGNMHMAAPDSDLTAPDLTTTMLIIPDSFDESHLDIRGSDHIISSSKEAHPADFNQLPIIQDQVAVLNVRASVSEFETRNKDICAHEEACTIQDENVREDYTKNPMSALQCSSPTERNLSEGSQDPCAGEGNCLPKENHYKSEDLKNTPPSVEVKDSAVDARPIQIGPGTQVKHKVYTRKRVSTCRSEKNRKPPSESDNRSKNVGDDSITKVSPSMEQVIYTNCKPDKTDSQGDKSNHEEQQSHGFKFPSGNTASNVSQDGQSVHGLEGTRTSIASLTASTVENFQACSEEELSIHERKAVPLELHYTGGDACDKGIFETKEFPAGSDFKLQGDVKINNELERTVELIGFYVHPMPISSVLLKSIGDEIYICALCGPIADRFRTLFMYKLATKEPMRGCPSFIGHTPAILPSADARSARYKVQERLGLQLSPDGRYLILLDGIKTPYCREGKIDCLCSTCKSACFEENTVRIVRVKRGHVSLVTKLKAIDYVQCLVVCEPNYLTAVGKTGRLIVWIMNSSWSGAAEEFTIPDNSGISSCIVELKKIPKCSHLLVGHNGAGEFTIWDISKRVLVSRFSSPSNSVYEFIPISMFTWPRIFNHSITEDDMNRILAATKVWFSNKTDSHSLVPDEGKDTAVWLLVSAAAESDPLSDHVSINSGEIPMGCWRLALLVKNAVIIGCQLDSRAVEAGAISGHGIVGTNDGLVYMWDLSSGTMRGSLHDFKGHRVSCIRTDDFGSRNLCIASDCGQLLVYCNYQQVATVQ